MRHRKETASGTNFEFIIRRNEILQDFNVYIGRTASLLYIYSILAREAMYV
jgi:hypothetical protein